MSDLGAYKIAVLAVPFFTVCLGAWDFNSLRAVFAMFGIVVWLACIGVLIQDRYERWQRKSPPR